MKRIQAMYIMMLVIAAMLLAACGTGSPTSNQDASVGEPQTGAQEQQEEPQTGAQEQQEEPQTGAQEQQPAANLLETIKQKKIFVVGTSADYPPYEFVDEAGNFTGFDIDIIQEIGKRMGVEVQIQDMAFDALIASLQEGKIDAIIAAMQATPERDEQVDFTRPYHLPKDAFLVAAESDITLNSPKDITQLTVGVQTGTAQERWVQENLVKPGLMAEDQIRSYERADQGALDLTAGRIDVLMIIADVARELAEQKGLKIALETSETIAAGQAIAIPQGSTQLKAELDRILDELETTGFITKIQEQYKIP